jgi:hypothetical protein
MKKQKEILSKQNSNGIKRCISGSLRFSDNELMDIAWTAKFNYDKKIKEEYSKEKKRSHKQWLKIILQLCKQAKAQ